jgi:hypothetical protein
LSHCLAPSLGIEPLRSETPKAATEFVLEFDAAEVVKGLDLWTSQGFAHEVSLFPSWESLPPSV